jgi:spore coat polysaccharide biosynthesis protein SpsF
VTTIAIVQARMGSTRLPGKILMPLAGRPALAHVVERLGAARHVAKVVVATTRQAQDDRVEEFCREQGVSCFRGSENDVLDRYYQAAVLFGADPIVRITADCPVIDPQVVDEVIEGYFGADFDIYGLGGEFPDGLDCTVYRFSALARAWREARLPSEREHVGPYLEKHPELFKSGCLRKFAGLAQHRWTLDEAPDLRFLQAVYERLYQPAKMFLTADILALLQREPELSAINSNITRNEGYLKSLEKDSQWLEQQTQAGRG